MILCIGLTPTVQRTMRFPRFSLGAVNRAVESSVTASGKAVNVARVLTTLGSPARLVQILGGDSGRFVSARLDVEGIVQQTVWSCDDAATRTCTTLLVEDGLTTELVEEAPRVEPHDVKLIRAAFSTAVMETKAICLSGSLPPGVDVNLYAELVAEANRWGVPTVADAQKAPLKAVLTEHPFLVKPNREEAAATLGFRLTGDALRDAATAVEGLTGAGAAWALVSLGKEGSLLGDGESLYRLGPPDVEAVNPIGSGDSLAAGLLHAHFHLGFPMPEACRYGTAVAAANCLTPTSGVVDAADVDRLLPQVTLESLRP